MASKGLGPLPRRRGSALAHGRGPLMRAAAVSTVHEALCMEDCGVAAANVPESLSNRKSNWRIEFGTTERTRVTRECPPDRQLAASGSWLGGAASQTQERQCRATGADIYLSSPALSRLVEELLRKEDFLSVIWSFDFRLRIVPCCRVFPV